MSRLPHRFSTVLLNVLAAFATSSWSSSAHSAMNVTTSVTNPVSLSPWFCQIASAHSSVNNLTWGSSERVCIRMSTFNFFRAVSSSIAETAAAKVRFRAFCTSSVSDLADGQTWICPTRHVVSLRSWSSRQYADLKCYEFVRILNTRFLTSFIRNDAIF